jgi:myo-inositol-1(or 4)-monophosphatase
VTGPPDERELADLARTAVGVLEALEPDFRARLGAGEEVTKSPGDFATAVDLALEERARAMLTDRTGLAVHGEEHGGPPAGTGTVWVLDPVDGTVNYSRRVPLTGVNLALLVDGSPRIGLTWLPLLGERYVAVAGGPLRRNGEVCPALPPQELGDVLVAFGTIGAFGSSANGPYPPPWRVALVAALARRALRLRVLGSAAVDLAWVATGVLGAAVEFGNHPWDNAAGACLIAAAGGELADLRGRPYGFDSDSLLAGAPGVVGQVRDVLAEIGDPAGYR